MGILFYFQFKAAPQGFAQLFMVSVLMGGVIWRPMLYVFQPDKYQDTYEAIFSALAGRTPL